MPTHHCISNPCWICYPQLAPKQNDNYFNYPELTPSHDELSYSLSQRPSLKLFKIGDLMSKNIQVQNMLETVEKVFDACQVTVEDMQVGQRMQIKDLASAVGLLVAMEPKQVLSFVNYYVHNTEAAYVTRGKNGGIIRGSRPVKVVKVKTPRVKKTVAPSIDVTETV